MQELRYNILQPVQLAMDNLKAFLGPLCEVGAAGRHILLEQLHMNVERTQRIAEFMSQVRQQPGQQLTLLLLGQPLQFLWRNGVSDCFREDSFHSADGNTISCLSKGADGIAQPARRTVQDLHEANYSRLVSWDTGLAGDL